MPSQSEVRDQPQFMDESAAYMSPWEAQMDLRVQKYCYVKACEGDLLGIKQGRDILVSKFEGYRPASASAMLAADWPESIRISRLMTVNRVQHEFDVESADLVLFRMLNRNNFFNQLREGQLCCLIELPHQILVLTTYLPKRGAGLLFPKDDRMSNLLVPSGPLPEPRARASEYAASTATDTESSASTVTSLGDSTAIESSASTATSPAAPPQG